MYTLNLPYYPFKLKEDAGKHLIMDELRKKFVVLTPEEWVRQHFVQYLIQYKQYPKGLISIEKGLKLNEMQKRTDVLIYSLDAKPIMLIECKAPEVKLTQEVFDQAARYNMVYRVPYLVITNGLEHSCAEISIDENRFKFIDEIPSFELLHQ